MRSFRAHSKSENTFSKVTKNTGKIFKQLTVSHLLLVGFILLFASIGAYLLLMSHASSNLTADFNDDSTVNIYDLSILSANWGITNATATTGDANSDGTVNIYDLSILASQWGQTVTPTPTPTGQPANSINVKDYGATGDGVTNDTAAVNSALEQAHQTGKTLFIPSGDFLLSSTVAVPNDVKIAGLGESSWLKGPIKYGSNETWTNLRIGARFASAALNSDGAHDTTFQSVRFSGGGGQNGSNGNPNVGFGGPDGSLTNISFVDCKFDATFTQPDGNTTGDNVISIGEEDSSHIQNLSFIRCIIGSSNGIRTGSPRFGIEALSRSTTHYLSGLHIIDSTFEPTDETALDIESSPTAPPMTDMLIQGNLIKGGNPDFANPLYQQSICLELGQGVQILDNTIGNSRWGAIEIYDRSKTGNSGSLITGNTITGDVRLTGAHGVTVIGNTFDQADRIRELDGASGNTITPNTP
jgi:hypothetical protein